MCPILMYTKFLGSVVRVYTPNHKCLPSFSKVWPCKNPLVLLWTFLLLSCLIQKTASPWSLQQTFCIFQKKKKWEPIRPSFSQEWHLLLLCYYQLFIHYRSLSFKYDPILTVISTMCVNVFKNHFQDFVSLRFQIS